MISQGFPLYATDGDGNAYAVVGWRETDSIRYPVLVPLDGAARGAVGQDSDSGVFRYTTMDPSGLPEVWPILESTPDRDHVADLRAALNQANRNLAEFRQCMEALAEVLETDLSQRKYAARLIRQELDR